jgi:MFS family permease
MVLIGRFLNGFGSARAINRRYIADTFSKADRTAASADFVTSGALGMAMGPAIGE